MSMHVPIHDDVGKSGSDRRAFFRHTLEATIDAGVLIGGVAAFAHLRRSRKPTEGMRVALGLIRPPGSLGESEFMSACIRCARCADACEVSCIQFFGPEAGSMQGTPHIVPIEKACTMCLKCGEACPTGAIEVLSAKEDIHMGTAVVDDRLCVSINGTGVCGACFTACPFRGKAITQGLRNAPEIHPEFCTGCGLCEQFCIVDERAGVRAIQVTTERKQDIRLEGTPV